MIVKELIEELKKQDPDLKVYAVTESGYVLAPIIKVYPKVVNYGEPSVLIHTEYFDPNDVDEDEDENDEIE